MVSPIPGASEKIAALRVRHSQLNSSIVRFESRISKQTGRLAQMHRSKSFDDSDDDVNSGEPDDHIVQRNINEQIEIIPEDFSKEEEEIKDLEKKKRSLENKISDVCTTLSNPFPLW